MPWFLAPSLVFLLFVFFLKYLKHLSSYAFRHSSTLTYCMLPERSITVTKSMGARATFSTRGALMVVMNTTNTSFKDVTQAI